MLSRASDALLRYVLMVRMAVGVCLGVLGTLRLEIYLESTWHRQTC